MSTDSDYRNTVMVSKNEATAAKDSIHPVLPERYSRREPSAMLYENQRRQAASSSAWHSGQPLVLLLQTTCWAVELSLDYWRRGNIRS
jgi:hypothetical protein